MTNSNVITNKDGKLSSVQGPDAIDAYRIKVLIVSLDILSMSLKGSSFKPKGVKIMIAAKRIEAPTKEQYISLNDAYSYFNTALFNSELPPCLITFQRQKKSYGYYWHDKLEARHNKTRISEIALAINNFHHHNDKEIFSTLVHEMCHHWQSCFGKASRSGYHNSEWAVKMETVGLMPSATAKEGGAKTGQKVSHYIIPNGVFEQSYNKLKKLGHKINWQSYEPAKPAKPKTESKVKYTCVECEANAWGKPDLHIHCGDCEIRMEAMS